MSSSFDLRPHVLRCKSHAIISCPLCLFLAFPLGNWRVSVDNTSTASIRFSWQNLQTLVGQQISHYFIFVKDSYGRGLKEYIVPGNTISHVVSGLTRYREYRLSVAGVNYSGNAYNSTEITAWTEEGGTCNIPRCCVCLFVFVFVCVFFLFICITGVCKKSLSKWRMAV